MQYLSSSSGHEADIVCYAWTVYVCVCISLSLGIIPPTIMCQNIKLHYFWHSMSLQFHTFDWKFNLHVSYDDFFHCHCSENCICFHGSFTLTHNQICTFFTCVDDVNHHQHTAYKIIWLWTGQYLKCIHLICHA